MTEQHNDFTETETEEHPPEEAGEVVSGQSERDWEAEARNMGWKPKDEWDGDPDNWRDAETFVKRGEEIHSYIKRDRDNERRMREKAEKDFQDRLKRIEEANAKAFERMKAQHETEIKSLKAQQRKAVEEGDTAAFDEIDKRIQELGPPPDVPQPQQNGQDQPGIAPEVAEWQRENTWFTSEPDMQMLAVGVAERVARMGGDTSAQLKAAEEEVRRRFPERFRQHQASAAVETGGQPRRTAGTKKGVSQLPREAREAGEMFVREGVFKDLTEYAKAYWEQN